MDINIPPDERQLYETYFTQLQSRDGYIDSQTARNFFSRSALPKDFLADMWFKADQNKDGRLDRQEFAVAMHIMMAATRNRPPNGGTVGGLLLPNSVPQFRPSPVVPVQLFPAVDVQSKPFLSAKQQTVPDTSAQKPWDFSAFMTTQPKQPPLSPVSVFPAPNGIRPPNNNNNNHHHQLASPTPAGQKFIWPTATPQPPGKQTIAVQGIQTTLTPGIQTASVLGRQAAPKTGTHHQRSKTAEFVRSKRKELADLKTELEALRKERTKLNSDLAQTSRTNVSATTPVTAAKKALEQTKEALTQTKRQAGVIQSANVLLERQLKQLTESVLLEKRDQTELAVPEDTASECSAVVGELRREITEIYRREKLLRRSIDDGAGKVKLLESTVADSQKKFQTLARRLELSQKDHSALLAQYKSKQTAVQHLQLDLTRRENEKLLLQQQIQTDSPPPPLEPRRRHLDPFHQQQRLLQQIAVHDLYRNSFSSVSESSPSPQTVPTVEVRDTFPDDDVMVAIETFDGSLEGGELPFQKGDRLHIIERVDEEWWLARDSAGEIGHVPANFMRDVNDVTEEVVDFAGQPTGDFLPKINGVPKEEEVTEPSAPPVDDAEYAVALYSYTAQNEDELSFVADDILEILPSADSDPDWFFGKVVGGQEVGLVPANYIRFDSVAEVREEESGELSRQASLKEEIDDPVRTKAIQELVDTEEKYLDDINCVMEIFYDKIKASGTLSDTVLQMMFFVWPDIIESSTALLSVLHDPRAADYGPLSDSIGAILCAHLPSQTPYVTFCSNQVKISELIREKTAENSRFDSVLRACSQEVRLQGLPLTTAYVKPMQRITRYPLLIKRILDLTPATGHADYGNLKEALGKAEELCRKVNERVRDTENSERFLWLQQHVQLEEFAEKIKFDSATNFMGQRALLYCGSLFKVKGGREMVAFLFNDFLLFTTPPRPLTATLGNFSFDKRAWTSITPFRLYRKPLLLSGCTVVSHPDPLNFHLTFPNSAMSFPLKATTATECKSWMKKILDAVAEYTKKEQALMWRNQTINQPTVLGMCRVIVLEAVELKEKTDTFCRVSLRQQERKTKVVDNSSSPKWDQSMTFNIGSLEQDVLDFTVFSFSPYAPNGFLGRAELRLAVVFAEKTGPNVPVTKRLLLSGVESGEVLLKIDIQMFPVSPPAGTLLNNLRNFCGASCHSDVLVLEFFIGMA
ncbi:Intersectin-1 [Hypsibius exemplaris]|uniref:Intersectin-1 n=1 Tax=Hypsibius exemplaris TaxID=2072580 RepID=A0A9X6NEJ2_HYPEX|nr:Intersectin-1 [Hypsibius exemplaris]